MYEFNEKMKTGNAIIDKEHQELIQAVSFPAVCGKIAVKIRPGPFEKKGGVLREAGGTDALPDRSAFGGESSHRPSAAGRLPGRRKACNEAGGSDASKAAGGKKPAPLYPFCRQVRPFVFNGTDRRRQPRDPGHLSGDSAGRCGPGY